MTCPRCGLTGLNQSDMCPKAFGPDVCPSCYTSKKGTLMPTITIEASESELAELETASSFEYYKRPKRTIAEFVKSAALVAARVEIEHAQRQAYHAASCHLCQIRDVGVLNGRKHSS